MVQSLRLMAVLVAALFLAGCKSELYTNLSEREANQMLAALLEAGIPATKSRTGADNITVMVDDQRFAEAMAILTQRGLPAATYKSLGDVFEKEGIVSSPVEERARFIYAMSQELGRTIAEIDGVLSARVHVVLPETDMLGRDLKPSSASVFIRHDPRVQIDSLNSKIKYLIANSLEGLVYDKVAIVSVPAAMPDERGVAAPDLQQILGIWVHPASVSRLWMLFGIMGAIGLLGFMILGTVLLRGRSAAAQRAVGDLLDDSV